MPTDAPNNPSDVPGSALEALNPPLWARSRREQRRRFLDIAAFLALLAFLLWLTYRGSARMGYNWQWYRLPAYLPHMVDGRMVWGRLFQGLMVTLEISAWAMILALALGLVVALLRLSPSFAGRAVAKGYLELVRGTPLLVQLYLFYFILSPVLGIGRSWTGILALAFFEGAFASEILRGGILSVPKGQWEAATALDLTRRQSLRLIVLPQALPLMLPPLAGVLVSLVKDSAIVSVIAIFDLTSAGRNIISDTFMSFEVWFTVAALYLAVTLSLTTLIRRLEQRLGRSQGRIIMGQRSRS